MHIVLSLESQNNIKENFYSRENVLCTWKYPTNELKLGMLMNLKMFIKLAATQVLSIIFSQRSLKSFNFSFNHFFLNRKEQKWLAQEKPHGL